MEKTTHSRSDQKSVWNVPNSLTLARFILSVVTFGLVAGERYLGALVCFLIAASTDWIDGYWARKYGQVTKVGRIFDPFVDKIIICGAFIALVEVKDAGIEPWMAIVVVARELLVTSLRGLIEGGGGDFSAKQLGKWKMVLQCVAVVVVLLSLMQPPWGAWLVILRTWVVWGAIALTVYSGFEYVRIAAKQMQQPLAKEGS